MAVHSLPLHLGTLNTGVNFMKSLLCILLASILASFSPIGFADVSKLSEQTEPQQKAGQATYLGNEGLLIQNGETKVLFDPFFHNSFNTYHLVPEHIRRAMFSGEPPYDDIDAIFVSHAHGDHFAAEDVQKYLRLHPATTLIAPQQAIEQLALEDVSSSKVIAIDLAYQDSPASHSLGSVKFNAVRIPHAGWPQRADVANILYQVTLAASLTVIHMGDADPDDEHFAPLAEMWQKTPSNTAFPPYWFFVSRQGPTILEQRVMAKRNIGIHVPIKVPFDLFQSGQQYFTEPGKTMPLD